MDVKGKLASSFLFYLFLKSKPVQNFKNNTTFLFYNLNNIQIYKQLYQSLIVTNFYTALKIIPYVSNKINTGIKSATEGLEESLNKHDNDIHDIFQKNGVDTLSIGSKEELQFTSRHSHCHHQQKLF